VTTRDGELVCANHGAMFDPGSGRCTFGPCEGAYLDPLEVDLRADAVCLIEDGHEFVAAGPAERDPADLSLMSNIEF